MRKDKAKPLTTAKSLQVSSNTEGHWKEHEVCSSPKNLTLTVQTLFSPITILVYTIGMPLAPIFSPDWVSTQFKIFSNFASGCLSGHLLAFQLPEKMYTFSSHQSLDRHSMDCCSLSSLWLVLTTVKTSSRLEQSLVSDLAYILKLQACVKLYNKLSQGLRIQLSGRHLTSIHWALGSMHSTPKTILQNHLNMYVP